MFPFTLTVGLSDLRKNDRLSLHRQGLDMDMVALTPTKISPAPKTTRKKSKKKPEVVMPSVFEGLSEEAAPKPGMDGTARAGRPQVAERHEEPGAGPFPSFSAAPEQRTQHAPPIEEPVTLAVPMSRPDLIPETEFAPQGPLSAPLLECLRLYRDGLEFGCIALTHDLIEAVLRLVCRAKLGPKQAKAGDIRSQLVALCAVGVLPIPLKTRLEQSWLDRIDYQYLLPSRSGDREKLGQIAEGHVRLLVDLERHYFGYTHDHGHVLPHHPEYWPLERIGNTTAVGSDR